ncbi:hypothetical protein, partial [Acetatifactor aquisgranensis]|uniref:hypothetical protein n=1 Tax=Acetatifactor aquisgranensis TaxID=2941233 RepID=UPI00203E3D52
LFFVKHMFAKRMFLFVTPKDAISYKDKKYRPSFGTFCPKLHGDYVGNTSRLFPAPVLPSHIPPEKRTEKRGDLFLF